MQTSGAEAPPIRTVLVTGAARRVGRATALELARTGASLVLTYRTSRVECERTARDAMAVAAREGHAIDVRCHELDLGDLASVSRCVAAIELELETERGGRSERSPSSDRLGPPLARALDAIVHNASDYRGVSFGSIGASDLEMALRTEVVAPCLMTQALRGALERSEVAGGAAVVFYSDVHAIGKPRVGFTPYLVAKGAVERLAQQLALELAPRVRVHCIAPGVVLWPEGFPDDAKERILARTPLGRAGSAEDAARLVRFLAFEASFMTGETIRLDGGRSLR